MGKPLRGRDGDDVDAAGNPTQASSVRHGLGYSIFDSTYRGIHSEATFFIPQGQAFEYWSVKVTNTTDEPRNVSLFSYAELSNEWNYRQDLENLQYSQYVVVCRVKDGMIHRRNSTRTHTSASCGSAWQAPMSRASTPTATRSWASYRTQSAPLAVERGYCSGTETTGDNACASIQATLELAPGETRQVIYMMGVGAPDAAVGGRGRRRAASQGREVMAEYGTPEAVERELAAIRSEWRDYLAPLQVATPDEQMNSMINVWHAYQTHMTFNWSRGVILIEAGDRDGLGYRDTVQDMLAVTHAIPDAVRERLDMILTGQTEEGGAMPLVKPLTHRPGPRGDADARAVPLGRPAVAAHHRGELRVRDGRRRVPRHRCCRTPTTARRPCSSTSSRPSSSRSTTWATTAWCRACRRTGTTACSSAPRASRCSRRSSWRTACA